MYTSSKPDAEMSSTVATTLSQSVATDVKHDVSSTVATTTPTGATDVINDASSTTPNTPDADMSSTVATTTSPTVATDFKHDASSTTTNQQEVNVSSTVPNTVSTTDPADVMSSDLSTSNWKEQTAVLSTLSTATTLFPSAVVNDNCSKCCFKSIKTRNLDQQERDEIKHALKVQLAVNKTNLSIQKRKLISVYDSRPSSVAMGGLACVVLAAVVGVIVVPDVITLGEFVYKWF
ncbi:cell wall protein DAN4-like [Mizuhopecten yessoensis]|uniref:cell wall protein DAN4-like n=1 Tax=Mizuhopecten yessoensis TaxID=6573 RepID=UPI000B458A5B|nr:cell wall protein DAN4-like [Mizuhopecten yessoensis]